MDLVVFENNKPYVIDEFREGRFDYIELASDVVETKFFQFLFGEGIVERLARDYPSPRRRHYVPLWMYVCSQLSLRLHGSHSFHSYPMIIRAGGLIDAINSIRVFCPINSLGSYRTGAITAHATTAASP